MATYKYTAFDQDGKKRGKGAGWDFLGWAGTRKEEEMTSEEKSISESVLLKRKELNQLRDKMRREITSKHSKMDSSSGLSGFSTQEQINKHNESKSAAEKAIRAEYSEKIMQIVPEANIEPEGKPVERRKMGGPVKAGTPYIVGDQRGLDTAELFVPNIDGTILSNQKTREVYRNLTSRKRGRGGVNITTLPTITNQLPPPEVKLPTGSATEVNEVSSINSADPYRQLSPSLYGITV